MFIIYKSYFMSMVLKINYLGMIPNFVSDNDWLLKFEDSNKPTIQHATGDTKRFGDLLGWERQMSNSQTT